MEPKEMAPARVARQDRIRKSLEMRDDSSLVASLYERVDKQREINMLLNQYSEADTDAVRDYLKNKIRQELGAFRAAGGGDDRGRHSNPQWIVATLDGNSEHTFRDYQSARRHHEAALEHAKTSTQHAISHANLSDTLRRLGHHAAAVEHALQAVQLDPRNEGFWMYLVMGLYKLGEKQEANQLFADVAARSDLREATSVTRTYIVSYHEFQEMREDPEMPEVENAFRRIEGVER